MQRSKVTSNFTSICSFRISSCHICWVHTLGACFPWPSILGAQIKLKEISLLSEASQIIGFILMSLCLFISALLILPFSYKIGWRFFSLFSFYSMRFLQHRRKYISQRKYLSSGSASPPVLNWNLTRIYPTVTKDPKPAFKLSFSKSFIFCTLDLSFNEMYTLLETSACINS